jgi:release factor glutamine methyltransferase
MEIGEALAQAVTQLRNEGVDSPRLDSELLLAHVLDVNRAAVLAHPNQRLTPKALTRYRDLVDRRAHREPLAYILGHREFYGLDFSVNRHVLIPRPETELLVEHALKRVQGLGPRPWIVDVGAGSGAIAVTLAVHLPQARVYALDASSEALAVVAENAEHHGVSDRVWCLQGDLLEPLARLEPTTAGSPAPSWQGQADLITANLPYVTTGEWRSLAPEIRAYEPRTALDGGADGLDLIRRLLATASPFLRPGSALLVEIGANQGETVTAMARRHLSPARIELHQDYAGLDRLVVVQKEVGG